MTETEYNGLIKFQGIIEKLCNAKITYCTQEEFDALPPESKMISGGIEFAIVLPNNDNVDFEKKFNEHKSELESNKKFLEKIESKLNNEKFIKNAPKDIIEKEQKKRLDTISKIEFNEKCMSDMLKNKSNDQI